MRKVYSYKRKVTGMRQNAPHRNMELLLLQCCGKCCLQSITKSEILCHRRQLYSQNYNQQNYTLSSFIKTKLCFNGGRNKVKYYIPVVGQVCKGAFKKYFALSDKKITYILKKRGNNVPILQRDLRGTHQNNARKLLIGTRDAVIRFIYSYNPTPSHYRRKTTEKRFFHPTFTMRGMWREFIKTHPNIKSNRLLKKNKGPALSFSCFRRIFLDHVSQECSFRIARVDTCQKCDVFSNKVISCEKEMNLASNEESRAVKAQELRRIRTELGIHLTDSEIRYGSLDYDMRVLAVTEP